MSTDILSVRRFISALISLDDDRVMLFDKSFPLFNKEMPRAEFDAKVKENPMNDHLKVAIHPEKEQESTERDYSKYNPLMQEYFKLKDENPDSIILYRIGEFLEAMGDDAEIVSQALGLQLTRRRISSEEDIKMCGFPASRLETNLNMLLDRGHKVGISMLPARLRTLLSTPIPQCLKGTSKRKAPLM